MAYDDIDLPLPGVMRHLSYEKNRDIAFLTDDVNVYRAVYRRRCLAAHYLSMAWL